MREIKFRIWDNLKRAWISNKSIWRMKVGDGDSGIFPPPVYWKQHPDGLTYHQYTGMKTTSGKEVFEGDILAEKHDGGEGESNIGRVFFAAGTFMIDGDGPLYDHIYSLTPDILEDYEVIGNVFDNPELLKRVE